MFILFIFIYGLFSKVACALLPISNNGEIIEIDHFSSQKNDVILTTFFYKSFKDGVACKSSIAIFELRVVLEIYAFSPFNNILQNARPVYQSMKAQIASNFELGRNTGIF